MAIRPQPYLLDWDAIDAASDLDRLCLVLKVIPDERLMRLLEQKRHGSRGARKTGSVPSSHRLPAKRPERAALNRKAPTLIIQGRAPSCAEPSEWARKRQPPPVHRDPISPGPVPELQHAREARSSSNRNRLQSKDLLM